MVMTQQQQIQYLANIYYLARADGNFEVEEDSLLIKIAEGIGAGYLETRKALDMVLENGFKLKLPERFSNQLRTVEDMMLVAMSDKKLHKNEKKILLAFSKQLVLGQEQIDIIRKQAKTRLKKLSAQK